MKLKVRIITAQHSAEDTQRRLGRLALLLLKKHNERISAQPKKEFADVVSYGNMPS